VSSISDSAGDSPSVDTGWRGQRRIGMASIAVSSVVALVLWLVVRQFAPALPGMDSLGARMAFALKCVCVAILFCLATGIEAVAHERLRSPAFDPLLGHETRRLRVNLRYLQNTLEQSILFAAGLFGLAAYSPGGAAMRAVEATAIVWVLARFAFWIGYHRSAALRGAGAPGMALNLIVLLYVCARFGMEMAGNAGAAAAVGAFLLIEAFLFRATRPAT
jgi:uncharacterized MAPEG superfamily protein